MVTKPLSSGVGGAQWSCQLNAVLFSSCDIWTSLTIDSLTLEGPDIRPLSNSSSYPKPSPYPTHIRFSKGPLIYPIVSNSCGTISTRIIPMHPCCSLGRSMSYPVRRARPTARLVWCIGVGRVLLMPIPGPLPCLCPMGIRVSFLRGTVSLVWQETRKLGPWELLVRLFESKFGGFGYLSIRDSDLTPVTRSGHALTLCLFLNFGNYAGLVLPCWFVPITPHLHMGTSFRVYVISLLPCLRCQSSSLSMLSVFFPVYAICLLPYLHYLSSSLEGLADYHYYLSPSLNLNSLILQCFSPKAFHYSAKVTNHRALLATGKEILKTVSYKSNSGSNILHQSAL